MFYQTHKPMKKYLLLLPLLALGLMVSSCSKERETPEPNYGDYLLDERTTFDPQLGGEEQEIIEIARTNNDEATVKMVLDIAGYHQDNLDRILTKIETDDFYDVEGYEPRGCEFPDFDDDDKDKDKDKGWWWGKDKDCKDDDDDDDHGNDNIANGTDDPTLTGLPPRQIKYYNFLLMEPRQTENGPK